MNYKALEEITQSALPVNLILCKNGVPVDEPAEIVSEKSNEIKGLAGGAEKENSRKLVVENDEMWSFYRKKENQRWLWSAIDHATGKTLAFVFGDRKDESFLKLKELLTPFNIKTYCTDNWGAYSRHIPEDQHLVGKINTQKIERKHLTLRTRIKRLARKTICHSKVIQMHDIVIGLFINREEFCLNV